MIKYRWVLINELSGRGGEFHLAAYGGDGGDVEGLRVVREDDVLKRKELFEVFLFLDRVIEVRVTNPFDSGVDKGPLVVVEVVTPENEPEIGDRGSSLSHGILMTPKFKFFIYIYTIYTILKPKH